MPQGTGFNGMDMGRGRGEGIRESKTLGEGGGLLVVGESFLEVGIDV